MASLTSPRGPIQGANCGVRIATAVAIVVANLLAALMLSFADWITCMVTMAAGLWVQGLLSSRQGR
jgi:hypothetical protein